MNRFEFQFQRIHVDVSFFIMFFFFFLIIVCVFFYFMRRFLFSTSIAKSSKTIKSNSIDMKNKNDDNCKIMKSIIINFI